MENTDLPVQSPTDLGGVAIHLSYLRRDIYTLSNKIDNISVNFVTINDFREHLKADDDHEQRIRTLEQAMWKYIGTASVISGIITSGLGLFIQYIFK